MPRRTLRRRAALGLAAACTAATAAPAPAHAFASFPEVTERAVAVQDAAGSARRTPSPPPRLAAVKAARGRAGSAYAMGATGPDAFDCSGLTQYAFARAGIALPRTSQAQFAAGRAVARDEVRAGDLVFFSTAGPGASHVGIATGRDTAISATSSGGVREHSTADAYWGAAYVGARRP